MRIIQILMLAGLVISLLVYAYRQGWIKYKGGYGKALWKGTWSLISNTLLPLGALFLFVWALVSAFSWGTTTLQAPPQPDPRDVVFPARVGTWKAFEQGSAREIVIPAGTGPRGKFGFVTPPNRGTDITVMTPTPVYLVSGLGTNQPQPMNWLEKQARKRIPGFTLVQRIDAHGHWPNAKTVSADAEVMFLQPSGEEEQTINVVAAAEDVVNYVVEVDRKNSVRFRTGSRGWRYIWIVPLNDPEYQGMERGELLPVEGLKDGALQPFAPFPVTEIGYGGLYIHQLSGYAQPLTNRITLSGDNPDHLDKIIEIGVNTSAPLDRPFRVIIGGSW